jgi:peptidoglycan/LPS O-acetylase OafA/YrhL
VAATWVVGYHLVVYDGYDPAGPAGVALRHGYLAVDLFFLLSGFVISLSYRRLFDRGTSLRNYAVFLLRRLARIYPLYVAVIAFMLVLYGAGLSHGVTGKDLGVPLAENLLLVQAWGLADSLNGPSWSISTEFAAYLLFPWLLRAVLRRPPAGLALVAVVSLAALFYMASLPDPAGDPAHASVPLDIAWSGSVWPLMRCLAEFSLGIVIYAEFQDLPVRRAAFLTDSLAIVLLALLCLHRTDVAAVATAALLILALAADSGAAVIGRLLASPPIFFLGEISYSIYLLHLQEFRVRRLVESHLLRYLRPQLADVLALLAFFAVLFASASLTYFFLEKPARDFFKRREGFFLREERKNVLF